jgi:putative membrane protein
VESLGMRVAFPAARSKELPRASFGGRPAANIGSNHSGGFMSLIMSLHIVFLIIWSAALLYLPQVFALHVHAKDAESRRQAIRMQNALYVFAMTPSAVLTVLAGGWLLFERGFGGGWLPVKLSVVLLMVFFHLYCGQIMFALRMEGPQHGSLFYRALSLGPAVLITIVVTLVVSKPF